MRNGRPHLAVLLLTLALVGLGSAGPAEALFINATFDSSVLSRPDASQIQSAFNAAAAAYQNAFSDPVIVNIKVSWGSVGGYAMPNGALGASLDRCTATIATPRSARGSTPTRARPATTRRSRIFPWPPPPATGSCCRGPRPRHWA